MLPRARFTPPPARAPQRERSLPIPTTGGLHTGVHPPDLPRGFTPDARNFVPKRDGYITPRSGLSSFPGSYVFPNAVLSASEIFDVNGNFGAFAVSSTSAAYTHPSNSVWSDLSYLPGTLSWTSGNISGTSGDFFNATTIYAPTLDQNICVFSNNTDSTKFFVVGSSTGTFSDYTWGDSIDSMSAAADVLAINDRLLFFNILTSAGTRFPNRAQWSARGNPLSHLIVDGAGAEDIKDMVGTGQRVVPLSDFALMFTEVEIWRATPTLDAYAFRFDRVVDNLGCPFPRTIVSTPFGVIFLGRDLELYVTDGSQVRPLGPVEGGASRIQTQLSEAVNLSRAWASYDITHNRYTLHYATSASAGGWPTRALALNLNDRTFWPLTYTHGLSAGSDVADIAMLVSWDDMSGTWDDTTAAWDDLSAIQGNRRVNVFTSSGTIMTPRSDQTTDDGTAIDVRWRTGGLRGSRGMMKQHLKEIWVNYAADSASSASIYVGSSHDSTSFEAAGEISLTTGGDPIFVPVWKTDRHPAFEIRINDGGTPRIASFNAVVQEASKF